MQSKEARPEIFPRWLWGAVLLILLPVVASASRGLQLSEGRHALVIGNGAYRVSPLKNPGNDAHAMVRVLSQLGFTVIHRQDANLKEMEAAVREFGRRLELGGIGLFYYAGHGMQVNDHNYLIPVDAQIESASDVRYEALDVGRVLGKMEDAGNGVNLVVLDACRDNPFARGFRSASSGLARMDAPRGTLIAYATAPGSVAADGDQGNGVYTKYLLQHMRTPGLPVEQVFKNVRIDVIRETSEKQIPWEASSLTGHISFAPDAAARTPNQDQPARRTPAKTEDAQSYEALFWESIKDSRNPAMFAEYLRQYPDGVFAGLAKIQLESLPPVKPEKAPAASEPKIEKAVPRGNDRPVLAYARDDQNQPPITLRCVNTPVTSEAAIDAMLQGYGFFDAARNPRGDFQNDFEDQGNQTVYDRRTGLLWQKAGSSSDKSFIGAKQYVEQLNRERFAGQADWRLPTLEELASTIAKQKSGDLHLAPVFADGTSRCWSGDPTADINAGVGRQVEVWIVDYRVGKIVKAIWYPSSTSAWTDWYKKNERNYVKAVRTSR